MAEKAHPTIAVATDCSFARLQIPGSADPQTVCGPLLVALARERGVEVSQAIEARFTEIASQFASGPAPVDVIFARAVPPRHGDDARIEWASGFDPGAEAEPVADERGRIDYYARRTFIAVRRGDCLGRHFPPTLGVDGRDVTGNTIAARDGRNLGLEIEPSIILAPDGRLLADIDGMLRREDNRLRVDPVLEIKGGVDFATGHIDFEGDVLIHQDIRDRFRVRSSKNVTVEGLVDASFIECKGDLHARRGIAGREEGRIDVGGDAHVSYLDKVEGTVAGDLRFTRAIMHCQLSVGRHLISSRGVVIGGSLEVAGRVSVAELGSAADTVTSLRIGPAGAGGLSAETAREIAKIRDAIADREREISQIRKSGNEKVPTFADRLTELTFDVADSQTELDALLEANPAARPPPLSTETEPALEVTGQIHSKVRLTIGRRAITFGCTIKGPIRVWLEGPNSPMCRIGEGEPQPLGSLAGVTARAA